MEKPNLSVAVIVKNEERNISDCLKTVAWADEIVILDDHSTDKTVEIARSFTDKIHERKMDVEGTHRNYLYSLCSNEWVLSLDADERVAPELKREIVETLKKERESPRHNAYSIPIKTYIGDKWAQCAGWYPAPKVRLFRKSKFRYDDSEVHPRIYLDGSSGFLKGDIIHYGFKDLADLFRNVNEQTTLQAIEWHRQGKKFSLFTLFRTPIDRFIRKYFFKGGIKGGLLGLILSLADSLYQFQSYTKLWELYGKDKKR
ncbi:MAG: glycosyltransferase family 2 protein [Candidatus Omnitrophica bacterium]|nr:glycosyltransferase family 2 protein [Candidatus Omnitrophota bacterium]